MSNRASPYGRVTFALASLRPMLTSWTSWTGPAWSRTMLSPMLAHIGGPSDRGQGQQSASLSGVSPDRLCQSNGGRLRVARHAGPQTAIYATSARHSANAAERLCL